MILNSQNPSSANFPNLSHNLPPAYRYAATIERTEWAFDFPRVVFIEVTNHCNLRCVTCARTSIHYEQPQTLAWENFLRIVAQFPEMQRAVLHGIGEPLLNPQLARMVKFLKARNVTVLFNTNATLLNADWSRELIASGLDEIRVSLDAAHPHTYAHIRGASAFPAIVQNLQRLIEIQHEMNLEKPRISVWMTGMRENISELPDLVRLAARIGVPQVYLQRMVYSLDETSMQNPGNKRHPLARNVDSQVEQALVEAENIARESGVILQASGATNPRQSLDLLHAHRTQPWAECLRLWSTAYVTANGNCLPCCIAPFATQNYESIIMGNLFAQPFTEIWNAKKYRSWRQTLLSETPPPACRGCGVHWNL
jgi:MoaA/NifB/PqqE/SkfB family radical SAM enzyme